MESKIQQKQPTSLANFGSWLGSRWEWVSILLTFLTLEIAVFSIEQAKWIKPQPSLTLVLALAVLTGFLLIKIKLPGLVKWFFVTVIGVGITIWQASTLLPTSEVSPRIYQLMAALYSWWQAISMAQPSEGTIHFVIFLLFFSWMLGYVSTWFILRKQNAWIVVALGAVTILVNLGNLPITYYRFFFLYLLAAMLLVGETSLVKLHYRSAQSGGNYTNSGVAYFMASVFLLSTLATSIAWFTPEIRVSPLEATINAKIPGRQSVEKYLTNFLAAVPRKQPFLKADEQGELFFRDVFERNEDDVYFIISSESPHYWRTRSYDVYTSSGWANSKLTERMPGQEDISAESDISFGRREVNSVVTNLKTDILLTAGEFVSSDIPASLEVLSPLSFDGSQEPTKMGNIVAVVTPYPLNPKEHYIVTINTVSATSAKLSKAGNDYPSWVTDYYLQLPDSLPERVRQLSEEVTKEAATPYDKVVAIREYMARFPYSPAVEPPPEEARGVDHFLFVQQSGNCVYFASTMAVMLRAVGVPARFSVGYLPGEWDMDTESYIIRARHFHAWPEVYFPGYGWVQFEAIPQAGNTGEIMGVEPMREFGVWDEEEFVDITAADNSVDTTVVGTTAHKWLWLIPIAILGGVALLLIIIFIIFTLRSVSSHRIWHLEGADYASEIYEKMCSLASLAKLGPKAQQTPLEYGACLASEFPQQAGAINHIINTYLESRFSRRKELGLMLKAELMKSRREAYTAILERLPRRRRS